MAKRTYAVMGATGHVGNATCESLLERGHEVRAIARDAKKLAALEKRGAKPFPVTFDRSDSLAEAFRGADAVFGFLPPGYDQPDLRAYQDRVGDATATALRKSSVRKVVSLSSLGAEHPAGTGPIVGLHLQERRLDALKLDVVHLRAGYFMENHLWALPAIRQSGIYPSPLRADKPIHMVATRDIGAKAAELLDRLDFQGSNVHPFVGPRAWTMRETAAILGKAIGKPDLPFVQASFADARAAMLALGLLPRNVDWMLEMMQSMNDGKVEAPAALKPEHQGKTTLEDFAKVFARAHASA